MKFILKSTLITLLTTCIFCTSSQSQTPTTKLKPVLFEGLLIAGYVDRGAYFNCTGPAVKFTQKPFSILLGLLPGLRLKKDNVPAGSPANAMLTPSLGFGVTAVFKHLAVQLPFYYNSKTATKNGKWNPGVGLGYKF